MSKMKSVSELEERAMRFRNFNGYETNREKTLGIETGRNYSGPSLGKSNNSFTMHITNTGSSAVARTVALLPGYFSAAADIKDAAGTAVAAIVVEGNTITASNADLVTTGKPKTITELKLFLLHNPTRLTGIKIKVDDADQFSEDLVFRKSSPFREMGFVTESPSNYENSMQNNDKIVEIPLKDAQLDNQTPVIYTIKAGRTVDITFYFGAILNEAANLSAIAKGAGA